MQVIIIFETLLFYLVHVHFTINLFSNHSFNLLVPIVEGTLPHTRNIKLVERGGAALGVTEVVTTKAKEDKET